MPTRINSTGSMGDGDAVAIGGNHLIHAARRNIDLTAIVMNNNIYGMTGGQHSPTTCYGDSASTMPYGNIDRAFDIVQLALGAGASFVARTTTYHVTEMVQLLEKAIMHKGFALVEILSQCPTYYGRRNNLGSAVDMLNHFRKNTVSMDVKRRDLSLIKRGIFRMEEYPEFCTEYEKLVQKLAQSQEDIC